MTEPVLISVPLRGDDVELQAIGAIVHLFEMPYWRNPHGGLNELEPAERDRIARYLFDRYAIPQTRAE